MGDMLDFVRVFREKRPFPHIFWHLHSPGGRIADGCRQPARISMRSERSKEEGEQEADRGQDEIGQQDAHVLPLLVQIVEFHDVVVDMVG